MKDSNLSHKIHSLRYDPKKKIKSKTEAKENHKSRVLSETITIINK